MDPAQVDVGRDLADFHGSEEVFGAGLDERAFEHFRERLVLGGGAPAALGFAALQRVRLALSDSHRVEGIGR